MKKILFIILLIIIVGYIFYMIVGISSTNPPLKKYTIDIERIDFEKKLNELTIDSPEWSTEKTDSIMGNNQHCYWISLHYRQNKKNLEYRIKYCESLNDRTGTESCLNIFLLGAFDYQQKKGGYEISDEGVNELILFLEMILLDSIEGC